MGVIIRPVRAAAITSGTTQDFTIAGIGAASEIKGARFYVSRATVDDTGADHAVLSRGATDGTRSRCVSVVMEDGQNPSDTSRRGATDEVIQILALDGSIDGEANFDSFITDGVRINWGNLPAAAYLVTCVLFVGDVTIRVDDFTTNATENSTTVVSSLSERPEAIFFDSIFNALNDTAVDDADLASGYFADGASIEQASWGFRHANGVSPTQNNASLSVTRCITHSSEGAGVDAGCEITAVSSTGFTATTRDGAGGDVVVFMALSFGGVNQANVSTLSSPTAVGNQAETGVGFKPGFVDVLHTQITAAGFVVDNRGGSHGVGVFTETEEFSHNITNQDNQTTSQTTSWCEDQAIQARVANGTGVGSQAEFVSMDSDGFTLDWINVFAIAARVMPYLAIELVISVEDGGGSLPSLTGAGVVDQRHELGGGGNLPALTGSGVLEQRHELGGGGSLPSLTGAGVLEQRHALGGGGSLPALTGSGTLEQRHELGGGGSLPALTGAGVLEWLFELGGGGSLPALTGSGVLEQRHEVGGGGNLPALTGAGTLEQRHELGGGGLLPLPIGAGVVSLIVPLTPDPLDFSIVLPAIAIDGTFELGGGGDLPGLTGAGVLEQRHELGGGGTLPSLTGAGVLEWLFELGGGGNLPALTGAGVLEQRHELGGGGLLPLPVGAGVISLLVPLTPDPLDFTLELPAIALDDPALKPDPLDFTLELPAIAVFTGLGRRLLQFDATVATNATYTDAEIT